MSVNVLRSIWMERDLAVLVASLEQALKEFQRQNTDARPYRLVDFTKRVLEVDTPLSYRIYVLLVWMATLPSFRRTLRAAHPAPARFDRFMACVDVELERQIRGYQPDGSKYPDQVSCEASPTIYYQRHIGWVVDRLRQQFIEEDVYHTTTCS